MKRERMNPTGKKYFFMMKIFWEKMKTEIMEKIFITIKTNLNNAF